jgi:hypothetical protein
MKARAFLLTAMLSAIACQRETTPQVLTTRIVLDPGTPVTRTLDPDEQLISDYNLLIFNAFGVLEEKVYIPRRKMLLTNGKIVHETTLLKDVPYSIYAVANIGFELPCSTLSEVRSYRYHLTYPDEYSRGIPMAGKLEEKAVGHSGILTLPLERLMARVNLSIDRSALDADVSFNVEEVVIGGCPSSALLFGESRVEGATQTFATGFTKAGRQADALNRDVSPGLSGTVGVYLLENCQGDLLENVLTPEGRVFTEGRYRDICSYIELRASYRSLSWTSMAGKHLIYRFYLGESLNNFDVRRNTLYSITVKPRGDGLSETSWRVDKSGLTATKGSLDLHPAAYNECGIGDDYRIWCDVIPPDAPFYMEPLAHDDDPEVTKLYSYTVDPDGHGLTIHTWKGGTAVVYFKAGPPVNRDTLAMLVIGP